MRTSAIRCPTEATYALITLMGPGAVSAKAADGETHWTRSRVCMSQVRARQIPVKVGPKACVSTTKIERTTASAEKAGPKS